MHKQLVRIIKAQQRKLDILSTLARINKVQINRVSYYKYKHKNYND